MAKPPGLLMSAILDIICYCENALFWPFIWKGLGQHSPLVKNIFLSLDFIFTFITGTVLPERIVHFLGKSPKAIVLLDRSTFLFAQANFKASDLLDESLIISRKLSALKSAIKEEAKTMYSHECHLDLLHSLWTSYTDNSDFPKIPDSKWKTLGFQGTDPATDFRGMGIFGLNQLLQFNTANPTIAMKYYREAQIDKNWFFPVLFGINVTAFVYESLMRGDLDVYIVEQNKSKSFRNVIDSVYSELYKTLCDKWLSMDLDAMHFAYMFNQVKTEYKCSLKLDYFDF